MSYAFIDAEATALPDIALGADQDGIAVLLRREGRPIHYSLHATPPGAQLSGGDIWALVGRHAGAEWLAQEIRDDLAAPLALGDFSITVAVCTRDRTELLSRCLRSLAEVIAWEGDADVGMIEVLVVDNDPPDESTRRFVDSTPGVRYVTEPRPGLNFARNRAIADAAGDFVAFLDDDVIVDSGWLSGLREAMTENPDAGAITGLVLPAELETHAQVAFERRGGFRRGMRKLRYQGESHPDNALYPTGAGMFGAGCNMVLRRDLVRALGGFDDALDTGPPLPGGGDLDIFHRVLMAGQPLVYEPSMLVFHRHRREHAALRRQYWSWGDGLMAYVVKTYRQDAAERPKLRALVYWWFLYASREAIKGLLGRRGGPDLALAELAGGVTGLAGSYDRSLRRTEEIRRRHA